MTYDEPYDYSLADSDEEAHARATYFRDLDPLHSLPPALLSSEHIFDYVRITGMLHPFSPTMDRLKSASYEVRATKFIYWDENGEKTTDDIRPDHIYELPPNSITFVQIESKIRLPNYIAIRFNLRIKHVHRGLLLGTGPLVDPGFKGDLLIPLHNLTSKPYRIKGDEGVIWIEFTKTSHNDKAWPATQGKFHEIQQHKTDVNPEVYFQRANGGNPIQSSIPVFVKDANDKASRAENSARNAERAASKAKRTIQIIAGVGILTGIVAVAGALVPLFSYFQQINSNVIAANSLASSVQKEAVQANTTAAQSMNENERLRLQLSDALLDIEALRVELQITQKQLEELKTQKAP